MPTRSGIRAFGCDSRTSSSSKPTHNVTASNVIPDTPAPHWQVVDSKGNVFLLNQLKIAGDKTNKTIVLPKNITDVAKVQIWCSFVEIVLGEATIPMMMEKSR